MNKALHHIIIVLITILSFACNPAKKQQESILTQAKDIVNQNPDSALILLNTIRYPQRLDNGDFADFALIYVRAKDKINQDISSDTIIFRAARYLETKDKPEQTALAYFYSGRVFLSQKDFKSAMESYLKAGTFAEQTADSDLKGVMQQNIGELNYHQFLYDEAVSRFHQAFLYFFQNESSYRNTIASCNALGNAFLMIHQRDSAFYYYNKGLDLSKLHNDSVQQTIITHNIGIILKETGDFTESKKYFQQALSFNRYLKNAVSYNKDEDKTAIIYLNLAQVCDSLNLADSTKYYIQKTLEHLNANEYSVFSSRVYRMLSQLEAENKNFEKALELYQEYNNQLISSLQETDSKSIMEIQKKYDNEFLQNTNNKLIIQKQWMLLGVVFLFLVVILISFFFYRKQAQSRIALFEANEKIEQLQELANNAVKEDGVFRKILVERFQIFKKAALLKEYLSENEKESGQKLLKKFDTVLYGENNSFDWNVLYQAMNDLERGALDKIREKFPQLSEIEFKICCLTKAKLTNTEISLLMKSSTNAIQIRKTAIRKKLGMKEFGDIGEFLDQHIV